MAEKRTLEKKCCPAKFTEQIKAACNHCGQSLCNKAVVSRIGKMLLTSPIVINVPTRDSLAVETFHNNRSFIRPW